MAARGCGSSRELGGLYFAVAMCKTISPRCRPLADFLKCPPIGPIDAEAMGIPYRGVKIVERPDGSGMCDVIDWVGSQHYPNVLDFYYETANLGLSRRAPSNMDYSNLSPGSRIILIHERAIITNADECYEEIADEWHRYDGAVADMMACPKGVPEHNETNRLIDRGKIVRPSCASLWWQMVTDGDPVYDTSASPRAVDRCIGDTKYRARRWFDKHDGVTIKPQYAPGIFMILPLQRFEVVKPTSTASAAKANKSLAAAMQSQLPIASVDE